MPNKEHGKRWLTKMVEHCATKDEKTFQLFLKNGKGEVYTTASPRPKTETFGYELGDKEAKRLIQSVFSLTTACELDGAESFEQNPFWRTDIRRNVVGPYGLHVGIVSNGPERWILSVTATLTSDEVKEVKEACKKAHYTNADEALKEAQAIGWA